MKRIIALICGLVSMLAFSYGAAAQSKNVTAVLQDSSSGEPIGYATVSLTKSGAKSASKYALSDDKGKAVIEKVTDGTYTFKAELLGYKTFTKEITVKGGFDLGVVKISRINRCSMQPAYRRQETLLSSRKTPSNTRRRLSRQQTTICLRICSRSCLE